VNKKKKLLSSWISMGSAILKWPHSLTKTVQQKYFTTAKTQRFEIINQFQAEKYDVKNQ